MLIKFRGEAKLICEKKEENAALDGNHRRSPGTSIDFVSRTKQGKLEFAFCEISAQSQEHYVGDRKNMKSMLRYVINMKSELNEFTAFLFTNLK
ncbi:hypothetical protein MFLAVUS_000421 [Mucor flavus]|uniref:Uncharacterized protein n=1 Tax=Mucor flavus TaxID=439312 RepID=A0ABP9YJN4_9FUNG